MQYEKDLDEQKIVFHTKKNTNIFRVKHLKGYNNILKTDVAPIVISKTFLPYDTVQYSNFMFQYVKLSLNTLELKN